jgi:PPP family 3-phenylpropionic acid transporter
MKRIWPFSFYVLYFAGVAFVAPFMVLYYQGAGFSGAEIGLLTGIAPLVTLFSAPFWTGLADATRRHRLIMSLTLLIGAGSLFVFPFLTAFLPILLMIVIFNIVFAPISSFADSATLTMLADQKEMYGRIRLGGTIGFGLAAPLAGVLVQNYGLRAAFWGCSILLLLAVIVSRQMVHSQVKASESTRVSVRGFLMNRRWRIFLLMALAGELGVAAANNYLFSYLKELGANESTMGLALTIGTLGEIPVLFFGNRLIRRFKAYGLLMLAMVITGLRLLLFAAADTPTLALLIQLLNGLTFPAMWVAGVAYADEHAPAGLSATAQGLFGAMVFGVGTAIGGLIGGPLLVGVGGRGLYLVFGIVILITIAIAAVLQHRLPAEPSVSTAGADS